MDLTFSENQEPIIKEPETSASVPEESELIETVNGKDTMSLEIDDLFRLHELRNISQFAIKFETFLTANDRYSISNDVILRNKVRELTKIFTKSIRNDKV